MRDATEQEESPVAAQWRAFADVTAPSWRRSLHQSRLAWRDEARSHFVDYRNQYPRYVVAVSARYLTSSSAPETVKPHSRIRLELLLTCPPCLSPAMEYRENTRYEEQSGHRCEQQPTDHRPSQGGVLLAAFAEAQRHRHHSDNHSQCGHQHRTDARVAGRYRCLNGWHAFIHLFACEADHQNRVRRGHSHAHDRTCKRWHIQCCARQQQEPADSSQRPRQGCDDDEWIQPRLEVDHDQQIHQYDRSHQPNAQPNKRRPHGSNLSANDNVGAARQFIFETLEHLLRIRRDRSQITVLRAGKYVDDRLHVVVIHRRGPHCWTDLHQVAHQLWPLLRNYRNVHQVLQVCHAVLRGLHRHLVRHFIFRIEPEVGGSLEASAERNQRALRHVACRQPDLGDSRALDIHVQRGQREQLLDMYVGGPGNMPHPSGRSE